MVWHQVVIPNSEIADKPASALLNKFDSAYKSAGIPEGVAVYHRKSVSGDHIYYFSPAASAIAKDLLRRFAAIPFPEEPGLAGFKQICPEQVH